MFEISALHCHAVGELLECLTVEGDGHSSVSVKGELHTILHLWLPSILHKCVRVIFIPTVGMFDNSVSANNTLSQKHAAAVKVFFYFYLTKRRESFLMLTRLLRVFTGSWGAGVTYGNYRSWIRN